MSQTLLTPSMIAKEALMQFKNNLKFTKNVDRQYSDEFAIKGAKIGATVTIRKPPRFTVNSGPALSIENVVEDSTSLTLSSQKHVDFQFLSQDLTLTVDRFKERYLDNAVLSLANQVDLDGMQVAAQQVYNTVGVSGTAPSGTNVTTGVLATYLAAQQKLDEMAAPMDGKRCFYINPAAQAAAVVGLAGLFQSSQRIAEQYEEGKMGQGLGADWYLAQNVYAYTSGQQGGSPVTNSATAQTGSSLITNGWTAASANRVAIGDTFTIAGVYKVNPITKQSTGVLQQFVATAIGASDGSGNMTLSISPSIVASGPSQNVTNGAANSQALTFVQTASTLTANNILCHKNAFTLGCADLEMPHGVDFAAVASDPDSGLSLRIVRAYDIVNDMFPCRIDILYGWAAVRPEWACKILG